MFKNLNNCRILTSRIDVWCLDYKSLWSGWIDDDDYGERMQGSQLVERKSWHLCAPLDLGIFTKSCTHREYLHS
jgi:hypothetical protein